MRKALRLIFFIGISQLAGIIGSIFTAPAISSWYATLNKPGFAPPNWVFAPAWTILFTLMGIAAFLVYEKDGQKREVRQALAIFFIQLVLNTFWSIIFFGLKSPGLALIEIIILWLAILLTTVRFYRLSRPAGLLLVPYILWVTFAAILNLSIHILNP
jgi:tryptophan-rich sensory protein